MATPAAQAGGPSRTDGDVDMPAAYVFTPPAKIQVCNDKDGFALFDFDPLKHYLAQPPFHGLADGHKYYGVNVVDEAMFGIQVRDDAALFFRGIEVPLDDKALLFSFPSLKNICYPADRAARAISEHAAWHLERSEEVSNHVKEDTRMLAKVKEPRCFDGNGIDPATDLSIWLWEFKDYLDITRVPDANKATKCRLMPMCVANPHGSAPASHIEVLFILAARGPT
jgi:hypothetical protein